MHDDYCISINWLRVPWCLLSVLPCSAQLLPRVGHLQLLLMGLLLVAV
jgi:hypothetical protein